MDESPKEIQRPSFDGCIVGPRRDPARTDDDNGAMNGACGSFERHSGDSRRPDPHALAIDYPEQPHMNAKSVAGAS